MTLCRFGVGPVDAGASFRRIAATLFGFRGSRDGDLTSLLRFPSSCLKSRHRRRPASPAGSPAFDYGFVLPRCDFELAGSGSVTFDQGVTQAGVEFIAAGWLTRT